nr:HNH endonuclease [Sphingomonas jejuensis]
MCQRPLGRRVELHHLIPKSEGGRDTVPVHPICHRAIHAAMANQLLARETRDVAALRARPELQDFLRWIADKPSDFHAPTRRRRDRA